MRPDPHIALFIGPTLTPETVLARLAGCHARITTHPPIQQGDLLRMTNDLPDVIGIIDGYFFQVPSVLHKEILIAMHRGSRVLGASSLGALRAAELDVFGMEGVGEVYRMYKSGAIDGDDEVAVLHTDEDDGFRQLTEPLVNIRHNLLLARKHGVISPITATVLLRVARRLHFTRRTYPAVCTVAEQQGVSADELDRFLHFARHSGTNLKRDDAMKLLELVASRVTNAAPWPPQPAVQVNETIFLHLHRRAYEGTTVEGKHLPDTLVLSIAKLLAPSFPRLVYRTRLRSLTASEASRRGVCIETDVTLLIRFRRSRSLAHDDELRAWLQHRHMTTEELLTAVRERALESGLIDCERRQNPQLSRAAIYRRLETSTADRLALTDDERRRPLMQPGVPWDPPLLREAKLHGTFHRALTQTHAILDVQTRISRELPGYMQSLSADRLDRWALSHWRIDPSQFDETLIRRGFASYREFQDAARLAYVWDRFSPSL
jgi:hypothetical protein